MRVEYTEMHDMLDVCANSTEPNTWSVCWKCMRTLLTLEIAGKIERYNSVFDLDAYQQKRWRYIARVHSERTAFSREIVQFTQARGYDFPLSSRILAYTGFPRTRSLRKRLRNALQNPIHVLQRAREALEFG